MKVPTKSGGLLNVELLLISHDEGKLVQTELFDHKDVKGWVLLW